MKNFKILLSVLVAALLGLSTSFGGDADGSLKVISYNIRFATERDGANSWDNRKHATLELLRVEDPDLVGIQEVLAGQFDYLAESARGYGIVGVGRDDGDRKGEMMAVLYRTERFDKLDEGHFWLSDTPEEVSRGWDGACNRMVTWLLLMDKVTGKEIYFFNTHLDHKGREARRKGSELIAARIKEMSGGKPFVLTGDFNARADHEVLTALRDNFPAARDTAPITDSRPTFNGFGAEKIVDGNSYGHLVIDHIYYGALEPSRFATLDGDYGAPFISDHYPIEAVFDYSK